MVFLPNEVTHLTLLETFNIGGAYHWTFTNKYIATITSWWASAYNALAVFIGVSLLIVNDWTSIKTDQESKRDKRDKQQNKNLCHL
jgi:hypothetical protein